MLQEGFAMNIRAAVLAALLTCGFSLPATADEPGCQRPQLNEAEGNADGGITAEKHASTAAKRFEMMDKDNNGKITRDEIEASHDQCAGGRCSLVRRAAANDCLPQSRR